jgi:hypothetical protein
VEEAMMNLFTPPGLDVDGATSSKGIPTGAGSSSGTSKYGSCYWSDEGEDGGADDEEEEDSSEEDSATVRKVCELWKSKRRKEKQKVKRLRQEALLYDKELQTTKEIALSIQRSFEKKFDGNDDSQRFERYGSRAHFMKYKTR